MKRGGSLLSHLDQIRALKTAEPRIDCEEIRQRLGLMVQAEQVRRFCHRYGIPVNPKHTKWGAKNHSWNGGQTIDRHGYVLTRCPDHPRANSGGYVRAHRLAMEATLGRFLEPHEVVHHRDGDPQNNAPENLQLYSANRDHLAETLKGQRPQWTPEGRARISEGARRQRLLEARQRSAIRKASGTDADSSPVASGH